MDVKTKVSLSYTTPDGYTTMDCKAIDYSASENALTIECQEVQQLHTALNLIDAARAKAVAEIETLHRYLDECYVNSPDERRAVPLVDRVARLLSQLAEAQAEIEAAQNETVWLQDAMNGSCALNEAAKAQAEVARLREQVAEARALLTLAQPAYNAPLLWSKYLADWLTDNTRQDAAGG